MGVTPEELAQAYPRLYHMADAQSWESIRKHGLLSTSSLLDLYEVKDKKPSLINFDFANGLYIVPKELDAGYLAIGKQRVDFHRSTEGR